MSRDDGYTTGNLLDHLYNQKFYKLVGIDLSRQKNTNVPQKINFVGKLEKEDRVTILFISEEQKKNYSKLFFRYINYYRII